MMPELGSDDLARLSETEVHSTAVRAPGVPPPAVEKQTRWPRVEGFEILEELGRGGMGVVYKAWQPGLQRMVALKMILVGEYANQAQSDRFLTEAKAVAQLRHPHIVQLFDVGLHEATPFFYMEFVEGGSLEKKLRGIPQPAEESARLVELLASAVTAAHQKGIIHRDLKPANILLDNEGMPKITDFGLAKRLDEEHGLTCTGGILGTPSYMAPEQAEGQSKSVTPAADIFSLGAILYEMLTGRPPFRGCGVLETLEQVRVLDPVPPRDLRPGIPRDLETICLNCLHKEPDHRYATAMALAEDLRRFLGGESILARQAGVVGRIMRTLERNRLGAEFHFWSNLLFQFTAITLVAHLVLHFSYCTKQPVFLIVGIDCIQFVLMAIALWIARSRRQTPVLAEEHRLWLQGIGYLMACALVRFINNFLMPSGDAVYQMRDYPYYSILAALLFFLVGGAHWGRCYLFSAVFILVALLVTLFPLAGVLMFGATWSACLFSLALHFRQLGHKPLA